MERSCSVIQIRAEQSSIYNANIETNNEPLYDKEHLLFKFFTNHRYGVWDEDNKSNKIFTLPKRPL
jgi:hypothetical protein